MSAGETRLVDYERYCHYWLIQRYLASRQPPVFVLKPIVGHYSAQFRAHGLKFSHPTAIDMALIVSACCLGDTGVLNVGLVAGTGSLDSPTRTLRTQTSVRNHRAMVFSSSSATGMLKSPSIRVKAIGWNYDVEVIVLLDDSRIKISALLESH